MPRYRARVAYDGGGYQGFQRQPNASTVQGAIEAAIAKVSQQQVTILAAGRTDTGVHAQGQVIAFDVEWRHPDADLLRAINAVLPADIALQDLEPAPDFHPRYDARARRYNYTVLVCRQPQPLLRSRTWQIHVPLDFDRLQAAAKHLIGTHDFAAFGTPPQGDNTIRTVYISQWSMSLRPEWQVYIYTVEATAFLYHMVRRMVALQVELGRGNLSLDTFQAIVASADLSRVRLLAPPQGLILEKVRYSGDDT